MGQQHPPRKQPPNTVGAVLAYSKRFLFYGFAISVVLHGVFGPFVEWKPPVQATPEPIETVTLTKVVTPKPTATPTPTPPPTPTPTPRENTPPPQTPPPQVKLLVHPPKSSSESNSGPSEKAYTNTTGSENGVPQGTATTGPPVTAPPSTATPAPTPTKPACANPNAPARATQQVTPDMPEVARQMGATGTAQIKVTLDPNGNVVSVAVYKSTHNSALDQAAEQAAQQSKYAPEVHNCVAVGGSYLYVVTFESQ
jgi:TonB family protein